MHPGAAAAGVVGRGASRWRCASAVHRARGDGRQRRGARASRSTPRTCTTRTSGAFTGEVSAPMLVELGVHGVVLGHSERRQLFGETDRALAAKVPAALEAGLAPILCVGETEEERESGRHRAQAAPAGARRPGRRRGRPAGRGGHRLRADLGDRHGQAWPRPSRPRRPSPSSAPWSPSATPRRPRPCASSTAAASSADNAAELLAMPDIDGALVGGASLDAASFAAIVEAA